MSLNPERLKETYRNLSLVSLLEICEAENSNYAPEALDIARQELQSRAVSDADLEEARSILKHTKEQQDPRGDLSEKTIRGIDYFLGAINLFSRKKQGKLLILLNLFWLCLIIFNYKRFYFSIYQVFYFPNYLIAEQYLDLITLVAAISFILLQRKKLLVVWILQNCLLSYFFVNECLYCIWINQVNPANSSNYSGNSALENLLSLMNTPINEGYAHYLSLILCYGLALGLLNTPVIRRLNRIPLWVALLSGLGLAGYCVASYVPEFIYLF